MKDLNPFSSNAISTAATDAKSAFRRNGWLYVYLFVKAKVVQVYSTQNFQHAIDAIITVPGFDLRGMRLALEALGGADDQHALLVGIKESGVTENLGSNLKRAFERLISRPFPKHGIRIGAVRLTMKSVCVSDLLMGTGRFQGLNPDVLAEINALETATLPPVPLPPVISKLLALIRQVQSGPTLPVASRNEFVELVNAKLKSAGYRLFLEDENFALLAMKNGSIQIQRMKGGTFGFKKARFTLAQYRGTPVEQQSNR